MNYLKPCLIVLGASMTLCGCSGCAVWNKQLDKIPAAEFESFEYHRGGNVASADIVATGASIKDGKLTIDSLSVTESFPGFSLSVRLQKYSRTITEASGALKGVPVLGGVVEK